MRKLILCIFSAITLAGCAGSKVSSVPVGPGSGHRVSALAMAPGGGMLVDAVAVALSIRGVNVIDGSQTSNLMARLNITEIEISAPQSLQRLRSQGVDAILSVRTAAGHDQQPQSASARIVSAHNGKVIAGVVWQNGWGGVPGSPADRTMRKGLTEAAEEIATSLYGQISR